MKSAWNLCCVILLFEIVSQAQVFTTLYNFQGIDGTGPYDMSLVQGHDGSYYGTTQFGGTYSLGTVFKISADGTLTTLHNFCRDEKSRCPDGSNPAAGLTLANDGNYYGTTATGGAQNSGTIYKMTPQGKLTILYSFCSQPDCSDGSRPQFALIQAADGNFYGSTDWGGNPACNNGNGCGTIFKATLGGVLTTMHVFSGSDGATPAGLVQAGNGSFYGTTQNGGARGHGTVFKITRTSIFSTIHNFCAQKNCADGSQPWAALTLGTDGNLYGTTTELGANNAGTVFQITIGGSLTTLYTFCSQFACDDGAIPVAGVIQATDGQLYGATDWSGANNAGVLFSLDLSGVLTVLHSFDTHDGVNPYAALLQGTNGQFYGATLAGGNGGQGTIYSLSTGLGPFVTFVQAVGKVGSTGGILGQGFTGTTSVMLNGVPANFTVVSDTFIKATVPPGATTGYVIVTTPTGVLTSNVPFHVIQ